MAKAANAPTVGCICSPRAVPMAWAVRPRAKPCTAGSRTRSKRMHRPLSITPATPVTATATAASEGSPPKRSAIGRAMGMVADLGAKDTSVCQLPPSTQAMPMAPVKPTTHPTSSATAMGRHKALMRWRWVYSGTPSATVAGPIKNVSHCTPARYCAYGVLVASSTATTKATAVNTGTSNG